ncbi:MAG: mercury resistance system transport protein MerF [Pseudomonadota bacterium]
MNDRALIRIGAAGATVAAICCATPVLAVLLPLVGLGAWLVRADLVLFPLLAVSLGLIAWGVYRRRTKAACCETEIHEEGLKQ